MSLGLDILEAVKRGGMNKWKPLSMEEVNNNFKTERETCIDYVYSLIGNKQWTVNMMVEEVENRGAYKFSSHTVRDYLQTLLTRGKLRRIGYPNKYFK
jgi:hypothetical protein